MSWIELTLNVPQKSLEEISGYLFALGCQGINVTEKGIIIYFNVHHWSEEVKIGMKEYLSHAIPGFSMKNVQVKAVTDHDWTKDWKKFFKPIRVGRRVLIQPPWEKSRTQTGDILITINPKMAFGTGHHETTRLIIAELEARAKEGMSVLDVGTGSGILAIVAEKLGGEGIVAIDTDITALKNAEENLYLNNSKNIRVYLASLDQMSPVEYDLVCANINRNVLIEYKNYFARFIKADGVLILSGLLRRDESFVVQTYSEAGYNLVSRNTQKDWLMLVLSPPKKEEENESGY